MRQIFVVTMIAATIACGSSPTAPTPPPIPNLAGQWTGTYTVSSCTQSGAAASSAFCANLGSGGQQVFTPQQTGSNLTGTLGIGAFNIPVTGTVTSANDVALSGSGPIVAGVTLNLTTWRATVNGSSMPGTMSFTILTDNPIGAATVAASFTLTK